MIFWTRFGQLAVLALLSACTQLPLDGPAKLDIVSGASAIRPNPPLAVVYNYALVDLNPIVLDCLVGDENDSFSKAFSGPRPALRVGAGDVLGVSVFESNAGGLFLPAGANNRQGNFVTIPTQTVSSTGAINVPYAGLVEVSGRTMTEIESDIESRLSKRALEPQVIVSMIEQNAGTVTVLGDATGAAKVHLTGAGETVLDVISKAGGLKYPPYNAVITLTRKKRSATVRFSQLIRDPGDNVFVQPGDLIYVYQQPKRFLALGAVGASTGAASLSGGTTLASSSIVGAIGQFSFDQERLSLNEAIGKAGGLIDDRADPAQVFLYRFESRKSLERMGVDLGNFAPDQRVIPTVYRANFRDPSSFLFAQKFPMRDKDTIYVGNAEAIEVSKVFTYVRLWTSTAAGVAGDANIVAWHGP